MIILLIITLILVYAFFYSGLVVSQIRWFQLFEIL